MQYMGSKRKFIDIFCPFFQTVIKEFDLQTYIEPFVGSASIISHIDCKNKIGYDKNYPLISLHQKVQSDFDAIPSTGNREWWDKAKEIYKASKGNKDFLDKSDLKPWEIGAIEFYSSYSKGGFSRGYIGIVKDRDTYNESYRNAKLEHENPLYDNIEFKWIEDFSKIELPKEKSLIYCDPPYAGTKPYGYAFETKFNHTDFWNWVREISKDHIVFVSEQNAPEDFSSIWQQEVKRTTNKTNDFVVTEKLFVWNKVPDKEVIINLIKKL